jgi:hypothetical protein
MEGFLTIGGIVGLLPCAWILTVGPRLRRTSELMTTRENGQEPSKGALTKPTSTRKTAGSKPESRPESGLSAIDQVLIRVVQAGANEPVGGAKRTVVPFERELPRGAFSKLSLIEDPDSDVMARAIVVTSDEKGETKVPRSRGQFAWQLRLAGCTVPPGSIRATHRRSSSRCGMRALSGSGSSREVGFPRRACPSGSSGRAPR